MILSFLYSSSKEYQNAEHQIKKLFSNLISKKIRHKFQSNQDDAYTTTPQNSEVQNKQNKNNK